MVASYAALFAWSFAAATVLPLSSEIPLAYVVRTRQELWLSIMVATIGNYLGACTTYWIARGAFVAIKRVRRQEHFPSAAQQRAHAFILKWGAPTLALSWVPIIGDALVAAAGVLRIRFALATIWLVAGKFARYSVVAWLARTM